MEDRLNEKIVTVKLSRLPPAIDPLDPFPAYRARARALIAIGVIPSMRVFMETGFGEDLSGITDIRGVNEVEGSFPPRVIYEISVPK